ncbi:MAG: hypothetical protein [Caudoviricetes sp.]|nr:MAG: hypothetical protein [Caudoviricetes sp.]
MKPTPYSKVSEEEKQQMFSLSRMGVQDGVIMSKYNVDEDTLLRCLEDTFVKVQMARGYQKINKSAGFLRV